MITKPRPKNKIFYNIKVRKTNITTKKQRKTKKKKLIEFIHDNQRPFNMYL